jgi:hypothetical protein
VVKPRHKALNEKDGRKQNTAPSNGSDERQKQK